MMYAVMSYETYERTDEGKLVSSDESLWTCLTTAFEYAQRLISPINGANYAVVRADSGRLVVQFWPCSYWRDVKEMGLDELVTLFNFLFFRCDELADRDVLTAIVDRLNVNVLDFVDLRLRKFDKPGFVREIDARLRKRGGSEHLALDYMGEDEYFGSGKVKDA